MIDTDTRNRYRFFFENDGYISGRKAEGALRSARTERLLEQAVDLGVATVEWVDDDDYDHGFYDMTDEQVREKFDSNEWTGPYGCIVTVGDESESLWGIVLGPNGTNDPYARCVATELAGSLRNDLWQAISDAKDDDGIEETLYALSTAGGTGRRER